MKKPVEWWHLIFQTALLLCALLGMLWNFSTGTQKQRDDTDNLRTRVDNLEHVRHDDFLLQKADMDELKGNIKELNQKVDDVRVLIENKQDRAK